MNRRPWLVFMTLLLAVMVLPWGVEQARAVPQLTPGVNYSFPHFAYSPPLRKFIDSLPGLGTPNNLLQQIPVAAPTTAPAGVPNDGDYYEIALVEYRERMHTDLPAVVGTYPNQTGGGTKLRGYVQENNGVAIGIPHYLGPLIVATKGRPVRIKFTNRLPTGATGRLFIPVDTTIMGAGLGPDGVNSFTENRGTIHLHGGLPGWVSDGTAHQWITPAGESTPYLKGASQQNVPDMPLPPNGSATFHWPNQQSGRLMFYHDHAYGLTRLNVYAGEAAGYLLVDPAEEAALAGPLFPAATIPLIIQDKTFVNDATTPPHASFTGVPPSPTLTTDPLWAWGGGGNLWFPHVYVPNQDPYDPSGANPLGRWDYGGWFWPVFPVDPPYYPPVVSHVPESFMDTPVINGTAYPYVNVNPAKYRLRILNGSNDRMFNLQFYVADPAGYAIDAAGNPVAPGTGFGTEVKMVPAVPNPVIPFPPGWLIQTPGMIPDILDGRVGGVPDPTLRGPAMIQIGTEGGLLKAPAVLLNTPVGYEQNKRNIVVLNVAEKTLLLAPAERADVIVDFSKFAGKTVILYNDSPAPVPAGDPRYDFYTGNLDYSAANPANNQGGAPSTQAGFGPNTRTVMQFRVGAGPDSTAPPDDYDTALFTSLSTALPTIFAAGLDPLIVAPGVYGRISSNYLPLSPQPLSTVTVTNGGSGYNAAPTVTFVGGDGSGALGHATVTNGVVTAVILDNVGANYTTPPTVMFTPTNGGIGAKATANIANAIFLQPKAIQELFDPQGRMNSTLGVELPFTTSLIQTTIPYGFIDPTTETFSNNETQLWKITHNGVDTHGIHFHLVNVQVVNRVGWDGSIRPPDANELGWRETVRMNPLEDIIVAMKAKAPALPFGLPDSVRPLDVTRPLGSTGTQFTNIDPLTGFPVTVSNNMTNFGWEYTWHCHILGHEENDMMRPLVLTMTSLAPAPPVLSIAPGGPPYNLSWTDATPAGGPLGNPANEIGFRVERATGNGAFAQIGTTVPANATTYADTTAVTGVTYRYRVVAFNAAGSGTSNIISVGVSANPAPTNLTATVLNGPQVRLNWTDNGTTETGFVVERSVNGGAFAQIAAPPARTGTGTVTYTDAAVVPGSTYAYRVKAMYGAVSSPYSNTASVTLSSLPAAPTGLTATAVEGNLADTVTLRWTDNANNETGFTIQRSTNAGFTTNLNTSSVGANTTSFRQSVAKRTTYYYRVRANNLAGSSGWSNVASITTP